MWTKAKPCCRDNYHALLVACACISPEDRTTEGEDVKYEYLTEEQWVIREKLLGNCGSGTDEQKRDAALASFKAAIMDKGRKTKKYQGVWLVGVFAGITERLSTESSRFHGMKRLKTIADTVDFDAASSMKADDEIEIAGWKQQLEASKASHMISPNKVSVPDGLARTPLSPPTEKADKSDEVQRDLLFSLQRQAKVQEQEEQDDHEAQQAIKVEAGAKKAAVGRPQRSLAEQLSAVSKIVRDRAQHIIDAGDGAKRQLTDMHDEAHRWAGYRDMPRYPPLIVWRCFRIPVSMACEAAPIALLCMRSLACSTRLEQSSSAKLWLKFGLATASIFKKGGSLFGRHAVALLR